MITTPAYIVYEHRLLRNYRLIADVEHRSGAKIIMAFKANALWRTFGVMKPFNRDFTASSLNELQLGVEELGGQAHSYCPVYTDNTIDQFLAHSSHITFNSLAQLARYGLKAANSGVSTGLRVNPMASVVDTDKYNPALPGTRFGVTADSLPEQLPRCLDGFHFHALCESSADDLEMVLTAFTEQFGRWLPYLKWVNMGGGHLMTRKDYDIDQLVSILQDFRRRYPNLNVILEPGSAWTWQTGDLLTSVVDIVEDRGIQTAIIDASFACHMPDCLEMPYKPTVEGESPHGIHRYRIGGNSCLSGDFVEDFRFAEPLKPGQQLTFLDMNHYTTVKTNMFNGIQHPDLLFVPSGATEPVLLRRFTYQDYKNRMD